MEPIPFFALDDEFCRVGKIWLSPERNFPFARLRRSSGSRFALDLPLPTRARSSALLRLPGLREPQAALAAATAASRATSARVNAGPCPSGVRRLLNNGLRCGEGVCLGKLTSVGGFSAPRSCKSAPRMIEARTGPFLVLRFTMPARLPAAL